MLNAFNKRDSLAHFMSMRVELAMAAHKLASDILRLKAGEDVVIIADSGSDEDVVKATANATAIVGAKSTVLNYPMNPAVTMDPPLPVIAAMNEADVVIEFCQKYFFYSKAYDEMNKRNKVRYICLTGMNVESMIRSIGSVDVKKTIKFGDKLAALTQAAKKIRVTNPSGTDIVGHNRGRVVSQTGGIATKPGTYMLIGQVGWNPVEETINGVIAADAWEWNVGFINEPMRLTIKKGRIASIKGGKEAKIFSSWLDSFKDPNMYRLAHFTYGINPGILKLTGIQNDDERIFGTMTFGFGTQGVLIGGPSWRAAAHDDMGILFPSVYLDAKPIEIDGKYVHPELAKLCKEMKIPGY